MEAGKPKFKPFVWIRSVCTVWWFVVCLTDSALCCKLGSSSLCAHALLYNSAVTLSDTPWSAFRVKVSFFNRYLEDEEGLENELDMQIVQGLM